MLFRSSMSPGKTAGLVVLVASAGLMWMSTPEHALGGRTQPSPFAGHYCVDPLFFITISNSGRITGLTWFGGEISGRISADGALKLSWPVPPSLDISHRGPRMRTFSATGFAGLDADGNLYGVLEWEDGSDGEFIWPRCD